jgi:hypothetical protein
MLDDGSERSAPLKDGNRATVVATQLDFVSGLLVHMVSVRWTASLFRVRPNNYARNLRSSDRDVAHG